MTFYNDNDPFVAAWLRELTDHEHITPGTILKQDIAALDPAVLADYDRVHLFAGIGGWDFAFQLAGWPADRPVWTGSCPCQPLSCAGQRQGHADKRHLWPAFYRLIAECRPATIFGEQVAGADGREWLAGVRADLEALGYAVGAADLCAASVGAPHIRQRLFWVAQRGDAERRALEPRDERDGRDHGRAQAHGEPGACSEVRGLADRHPARLSQRTGNRRIQPEAMDPSKGQSTECNGGHGGLEQPPLDRRQQRWPEPGGWGAECGRLNVWRASRWHLCPDGKLRRIPTTATGEAERALFPLFDGLQPARVGILRGAGNAIVPQIAAAFIRAFLEAERIITGGGS